MARSFHAATIENTIGSTGSATFYHKSSNQHFEMLERDGRIYQRRYQIGFEGKPANVLEESVDFVLGSGNHARTFLHRTSRNTLIELPLGWYAEKGGYWAMNPGYDRPDHEGFRRAIPYTCMFCHNGIPEVPSRSANPQLEPVFSGRIPQGIDCQRCHGPGRRHVEMAESPGSKGEDIRQAIVNPARLSAERQAEICMQCHLETTSFRLPNSIVRYEREPFSYRPGEPLGDFMLQFDQAGGNDRFEIASAAYRMRRSACFLKTGGALRCTTCHNPHDTRKGRDAIEHYAEACRGCHAASFQQLVTSGKHPASGNCIDCHMPKRRTADVVHVVMTDHYIQRRPPAGDLLRPLAEIHESDTNAYHGVVTPYYPPDLPQSPSGELYFAVAQVSQRSNLRQGVEQLAAAIAGKPPARIEYYLHLADAYMDARQPDKAVRVYEQASQRWPDSYAGLRKLGSALRSTGQLSRASEVLKKTLAIAPDDGPSWNELGLSYLGLGMKTEALTAFQKAAELDPDLAEAENSLGGIFFENADLARAETAFREAIRIQPDYAEARSNLGNLLSASGRFDEARYHFETAIRLKPDYAAARRNYAVALAGARKFAEAQRQVEEELRIDPNSADAHDLLGSILVVGGNVRAALEHYREAVRISPQFGRAQLDLGEALAASGNIPEALQHLDQASHSADHRVQQEAQQALGQIQPRR